MAEELIVKTENLTKRFGEVTAVKDLNIEIRKGEVFGFLGPNGSGKTTTISVLLGLIRPSKGRIELFGNGSRKDLPTLLKRVGVVLENPPFYPNYSGRDNLKLLAGLTTKVSPERINEVLEFVGLKDRAKSKMKTYSLGMRQRLAIALALVNNPEFLILDEPTNGMDPAGIVEIRDLIRSLNKKGKTIFLASHLLHEVEQVCTKVAIIKKGEVLAQGSIDSLMKKGQEIRLKTTDNRKAADAIQNKIDKLESIEMAGDELIVKVPMDKMAEVFSLLAEKGISILAIASRKESLEDVFIELTSESSSNAQRSNT